MVKIVATSDTHGYLPDMPEGDLLIHAGDFSPVYDHSINFQQLWFRDNFLPWLKKQQKNGEAVFISGNHDFFCEESGREAFKYLQHPMNVCKKYYLEDSQVELFGLKIYGTPWQPYFGGWAFNLYEDELSAKWDLIPEDTDVLIVHGPPYGCGDLCRLSPAEMAKNGGKTVGNVGSPSLAEKIKNSNIKIVICGHLHEGYGVYKVGTANVYNVSYVGSNYKPKNKHMVIEL